MANLKIGNLQLKDGLILAPLAGINDIAFRRICAEHGASLVYTGMVNANALVRGNKATKKLAQTCDEERPVGIQIFGSNPETLVKAAKLVQDQVDIIDINMGCPDKNVIKQGAGSALLRRPKKIGELVSSVKKAIHVPLTVKIRSGIEKFSIEDTLKIAKIIETNGADALILHSRTAKQGGSGIVDWNIIKAVKEHLSIPVIGNGGVKTLSDAKLMMKDTGCDGVMIGTAAMGNPFIFEKTNEKRTYEEIKETFYRYLEYAKHYEIENIFYLRMQAQLFFKGFRSAASLRKELGYVDSIDGLKKLIELNARV
ncbi:MAG: tRNA-dihydrouridine synthase family protein [Candidatus Aenigmarchaeota archaeon]|nr:tRNA-dihydrouridine synthase family protein [Candidatus Aenigmarchaeota archaeon]